MAGCLWRGGIRAWGIASAWPSRKNGRAANSTASSQQSRNFSVETICGLALAACPLVHQASPRKRTMTNNQSTDLLFEISQPGRRCHRLPVCDVPAKDAKTLLPADALADAAPPLPEIGEIDLIRHYVNLSKRNMSIDTNFYPLGSCTMKYNPKRHERLAALPGMAALHPLAHEDACQGMLQMLHTMQEILAEISGLDAVSLQPAAGAQGELTALLVAAAYFRDKGEKRTRVLIPDSAHGTNPASAAIAGFEAVPVKSNARGLVDLSDLCTKLDDRTAVFMITNP